MKSNLMDKLSSYAALIGVIGAIGGGFYTWGEFNNRLAGLEGSNIDVSGIEKNQKDIAVINEKVGDLDLSGIAVVKKMATDNEEWLEEVEGKTNEVVKDTAVLKKEIELLKLEIEELKLKAKNPLAN